MANRRHLGGLAVMLAVALTLIGCGGAEESDSADIAFQSGTGSSAQILAMDEDGTNLRLVSPTGLEPSIRPDGRVVTFSNGVDIYTIGIDGMGLTQITQNGGGVTASDPTFSPRGDLIAYTLNPLSTTGIPEIRVVRTNGTGEFTLITDATDPTFSPDGSEVALVRNGEIFRIDTDGRNLENLTVGTAGANVFSPSYSPSGGEIVFASQPTLAVPNTNIRVLSIANRQIEDIVTNGRQPTFGPAGRTIIFVSSGAIFSVNRNGTDVLQLTSGPNDSNPSTTASP